MRMRDGVLLCFQNAIFFPYGEFQTQKSSVTFYSFPLPIVLFYV